MSIEDIYQLDATQSVQHLLSGTWLDLPMFALSAAGEGWFLALLGVAAVSMTIPHRRDALRSLSRLVAVLLATGVLVIVVKRIVNSPRPLLLLGPGRIRMPLDLLYRMSFPSGHAAACSATAVWVRREPSMGWRWWPWLFAFLVGVSRVYVGAHWVTDVAAGWVLGAAVAAAVLRGWPWAWGASTAPTGRAAAAGPVAVVPAPVEVGEEDP